MAHDSTVRPGGAKKDRRKKSKATLTLARKSRVIGHAKVNPFEPKELYPPIFNPFRHWTPTPTGASMFTGQAFRDLSESAHEDDSYLSPAQQFQFKKTLFQSSPDTKTMKTIFDYVDDLPGAKGDILGVPRSLVLKHALDRASFHGPMDAITTMIHTIFVMNTPGCIYDNFQKQPRAGFEFQEWVKKNMTHLFSMGKDNYKGIFHDCICDVGYSKNVDRFNLSCAGTEENVKKVEEQIEAEFNDLPVLVNWTFLDPRGNLDRSYSKLKKPEYIPGSFPWLGKPLDEYIKDYLDSNASVLILLGTPGTGKTSFLRELASAMDSEIRVTYDPAVLARDDFFSEFMNDDDCQLLVMEDADNLMGLRVEGNSSMQRFLNVSDGLVSVPEKKIVLTANLASADEIDPAFMRKGRCFDIIHTRALTAEEASIVATNYFGHPTELPKGSYTLADIVNFKDPARKETKSKVGFLA